MVNLYFSIEIDFGLAYLKPEQPHPEPLASETFHFDITDEVREHCNRLVNVFGTRYKPGPDQLMMRKTAAAEHIGRRLLDGGLPWIPFQDLGHPKYWTIGSENSVQDQDGFDDRYSWYGMKIASPTYKFIPESDNEPPYFTEISNAMTLLAACHRVKPVGGMRVYFSYSMTFDKSRKNPKNKERQWTMASLIDLMMFFWAFEPQFNTLHFPQRRQDNLETGLSLRKNSRLGQELRHLPFSEQRQEGLERLHNTPNLTHLYNLTTDEKHQKQMRLSLFNIMSFYGIKDKDFHDDYDDGRPKAKKPTVEFRQHASTFSQGEIENWINTLGKIILMLEEGPVTTNSLLGLIPEIAAPGPRSVLPVGGIQDKPEEEDFTIFELLRSLRLNKEADFYADRAEAARTEKTQKTV